MVAEIHRKRIVAESDLDFDTSFAEIDGVLTGDIVWSAPVTTYDDCDFAEIFVQISTGTSPTGTIEFYGARADGTIRPASSYGTLTDHGEATADANVTDILACVGAPLFSIKTATTDSVYTASFRLWYPGNNWQLFIYNNTGVAFDATGSPHRVRARGWAWESQ